MRREGLRYNVDKPGCARLDRVTPGPQVNNLPHTALRFLQPLHRFAPHTVEERSRCEGLTLRLQFYVRQFVGRVSKAAELLAQMFHRDGPVGGEMGRASGRG